MIITPANAQTYASDSAQRCFKFLSKFITQSTEHFSLQKFLAKHSDNELLNRLQFLAKQFESAKFSAMMMDNSDNAELILQCQALHALCLSREKVDFQFTVKLLVDFFHLYTIWRDVSQISDNETIQASLKGNFLEQYLQFYIHLFSAPIFERQMSEEWKTLRLPLLEKVWETHCHFARINFLLPNLHLFSLILQCFPQEKARFFAEKGLPENMLLSKQEAFRVELENAGNYNKLMQVIRRIRSIQYDLHADNESHFLMTILPSKKYPRIRLIITEENKSWDETNRFLTNALFKAIALGYSDITQLIIDFGANVNGKNQEGKLPISQAISYGNEEILRLLIKNGAETHNIANQQGTIPFITLEQRESEYIALIQILLKTGVNIDNVSYWDGTTLLFNALKNRYFDLATFLLQNGADINWHGHNIASFLHYAILEDREDIIDFLFKQKKLDINIKDRDGNTPWFLAIYKKNINYVKLFFTHSEIDILAVNNNHHSAIHLASHMGCTDILRVLLSQGLNINERKANDNRTPLMTAALAGNIETVKYLLEQGADRLLKDINDASALTLLAEKREEITNDSLKCLFLIGVYVLVLNGVGELNNQLNVYGAHRIEHIIAMANQTLWQTLPAELFAIVVFLCDGLLCQKNISSGNPSLEAARFFSISGRLPLELQMYLCNKVYHSPKEIVLIRDSETAFKNLAKKM